MKLTTNELPKLKDLDEFLEAHCYTLSNGVQIYIYKKIGFSLSRVNSRSAGPINLKFCTYKHLVRLCVWDGQIFRYVIPSGLKPQKTTAQVGLNRNFFQDSQNFSLLL